MIERIARYVAIGYLVLAVTPRLLTGLGVQVPLASFYWSLPAALLGTAAYASWLAIRGKSQRVSGMVLAGMAGVLLGGAALLRLPVTIRPLTQLPNDAWAFFGTAVYLTVCDLSAIVFLFALFLAAFVPLTRARWTPRGARA
jgi:hypothetical protein